MYSYEWMVNVETFENAQQNPYDIVTEIMLQIHRSMVKHANEINKTMILKKMNNEYDKYDKYDDAMKMNVHNALFDLEVKSMENKTIQSETEYILQISIIIPVTLMIYNLTSDLMTSLLTLLIMFSIVTFIYYMNVYRRVRTRSRQFYWNTLSSKKKDLLSPTANTNL